MIDRARRLCCHQSDPDCLARFKAERIDGVDSSSEAAKVGTAAHRACEAISYFAAEFEEEVEPDREQQYAVALQAIEAVAVELSMTPDGKAEAQKIMRLATGPTSRLRFGRPTGWTTGVEVRWALDRYFRPCDPDDAKRLAGGTIDRIDWHEELGRVVVKDYKTTLGMQSKDDVIFGWQPRLYTTWARKNYGVPAARFEYVNLRHGYAVGEELREDPAVEARVRSLRAAREAAVELDIWPETEGPSCDYCPIRHRCETVQASARSGRRVDPTLPPARIAARAIALAQLAADYDRTARAIVKGTGQPIELAHGVVLGMKPASGWRLAGRYLEPDGSVSPKKREELMVELRHFHMTPVQEAEWFSWIREGDLPGAVRKALQELLGARNARDFINRGYFIEPMTRAEFSAWIPDRGAAPKAQELEDILDELGW